MQNLHSDQWLMRHPDKSELDLVAVAIDGDEERRSPVRKLSESMYLYGGADRVDARNVLQLQAGIISVLCIQIERHVPEIRRRYEIGSVRCACECADKSNCGQHTTN